MPLAAYALVTLDQLKTKLVLGGDNMNDSLERVINQASANVESYLGRQIVSRGTLTEFHNVPARTCELYPGEWPIIAVSEVSEDSATPKTYGASTLLVADTDYELVLAPTSKVRRLYAGDVWTWWAGRRTVRIKYTAGYTLANVPEDIRGVALALSALYYTEDSKQRHGTSGGSDAAGNWTRFSPATLTDDMKDRLSPYRREEWGVTWERAS